jgi:pilus assembly protein Flp/PilA
MTNILKSFAKADSGATAIEYALIAAVVGIGIVVALGNVKNELNNTFQTTVSDLQAANAQ